MLTGTKNMTTVSCALGQISHNFNRRTQFAIGGCLGSIHSANVSGEYRVTNTTSVRCRLNRNYQQPGKPFNELSVILREQVTEDFAMEMDFTRSHYDELKLTASKNLSILHNEDSSTVVEAETKIRKSVVNGTLRLKNHIGDYYATQLELSLGVSGLVPMFTISSEIYYNLFQLERLFRNIKSDSLEKTNSRIKNINMIFGISYGFDGLSFTFGFDLAGITIKLPILIMRDFPDPEDVEAEDTYLEGGLFGGIVLALFLGSTYLFNKLIQKRKKRKQRELDEGFHQ